MGEPDPLPLLLNLVKDVNGYPGPSASFRRHQGIGPPEEIMSPMNGGIGAVSNRSPLTTISPLSISIRISDSRVAASLCDNQQVKVYVVAVEDAGEALTKDALDVPRLHLLHDVLP